MLTELPRASREPNIKSLDIKTLNTRLEEYLVNRLRGYILT